MRKGLFEVFGTGELGRKADDLNQHFELLAGVGLPIPEGIVIATGVFDQLTKIINFEEQPVEEIEKHDCPILILSINEEILFTQETYNLIYVLFFLSSLFLIIAHSRNDCPNSTNIAFYISFISWNYL